MQKSSTELATHNYTIQVFASLAGTWALKRRITNLLNISLSGWVVGQATFKPRQQHELLYKEVGTFETATHTLKISQEYLYRFNALTGKIEKHFVEKNRLFYALNLIAMNNFSGQHLCSNDQYFANYRQQGSNHFILEYHVYGPKKNYTVTTEYSKLTN